MGYFKQLFLVSPVLIISTMAFAIEYTQGTTGKARVGEVQQKKDDTNHEEKKHAPSLGSSSSAMVRPTPLPRAELGQRPMHINITQPPGLDPANIVITPGDTINFTVEGGVAPYKPAMLEGPGTYVPLGSGAGAMGVSSANYRFVQKGFYSAPCPGVDAPKPAAPIAPAAPAGVPTYCLPSADGGSKFNYSRANTSGSCSPFATQIEAYDKEFDTYQAAADLYKASEGGTLKLAEGAPRNCTQDPTDYGCASWMIPANPTWCGASFETSVLQNSSSTTNNYNYRQTASYTGWTSTARECTSGSSRRSRFGGWGDNRSNDAGCTYQDPIPPSHLGPAKFEARDSASPSTKVFLKMKVVAGLIATNEQHSAYWGFNAAKESDRVYGYGGNYNNNYGNYSGVTIGRDPNDNVLTNTMWIWPGTRFKVLAYGGVAPLKIRKLSGSGTLYEVSPTTFTTVTGEKMVHIADYQIGAWKQGSASLEITDSWSPAHVFRITVLPIDDNPVKLDPPNPTVESRETQAFTVSGGSGSGFSCWLASGPGSGSGSGGTASYSASNYDRNNSSAVLKCKDGEGKEGQANIRLVALKVCRDETIRHNWVMNGVNHPAGGIGATTCRCATERANCGWAPMYPYNFTNTHTCSDSRDVVQSVSGDCDIGGAPAGNSSGCIGGGCCSGGGPGMWFGRYKSGSTAAGTVQYDIFGVRSPGYQGFAVMTYNTGNREVNLACNHIMGGYLSGGASIKGGTVKCCHEE